MKGGDGVGEEPNHTTERTPGPLLINTLWLKRKTVIPYPKPISGEKKKLYFHYNKDE